MIIQSLVDFKNHAFQTYAALCVVKATDLAKIPEEADLVNIAALPTVTTTGAQLASLALGGRSGATVPVTGAVGNAQQSCELSNRQSKG
jgi:NADPH:quinone reductase-like Zn-dependent oxidoreductase